MRPCDVHPAWMSAWVGVFSSPYFAVTDESGQFEIKNVPAGDYTIVVLAGTARAEGTGNPCFGSRKCGAEFFLRAFRRNGRSVDYVWIAMADIALESQQHRTTSPGRIGIWLFLASEIMFFMGLLASYVIFRAAQPQLFAQQSVVMNKWAGGINTLILLSSSFLMAKSVTAAAKGERKKLIASLALVLLFAATFLGIKASEYRDKLTHYTLVAPGQGKLMIYDGHLRRVNDRVEITGFAAPMPGGSDWDIHFSTPQQVRQMGDGVEQTYVIPANSIREQINDGPWKNIFFACYFTLTAVHAVHLLGGMIAVLILLILASRGKIKSEAMEYVAIYWHFVDLVWIFLFVLLYWT